MIDYKQVMIEACKYALRSPDPSTQNSAVLLDDDGYVYEETWSVNEFPDGVQYKAERWERPGKYDWIEHSERNAIYRAAFNGISTANLVLLSTWAPCADCARAIIQSGIATLVTLSPEHNETNERWDNSFNNALQMLKESYVNIVYLDRPLNSGVTLLRNGNPFQP